MRLDKFLKVSRLIKRRTVANEACDAGRVLVNDKPAKASAQVKAGDIIGFMGNTGYGPEGTKGMFATHLHLGIYLYPAGKETSYNPYWILRLAGEKKLSCSF